MNKTAWPTKWLHQLDGMKERVKETETFYTGFAGSHGVCMAVHKGFIAPSAQEKGNYHYFSPKVFG